MTPKYYITFETFSGGMFLMGRETVEHTWTCTEAELDATLERVAVNKHKVTRVVYGVELDFRQEVKILSKPSLHKEGKYKETHMGIPADEKIWKDEASESKPTPSTENTPAQPTSSPDPKSDEPVKSPEPSQPEQDKKNESNGEATPQRLND